MHFFTVYLMQISKEPLEAAEDFNFSSERKQRKRGRVSSEQTDSLLNDACETLLV